MLRFRVGETIDLDTFVNVGKTTVDNLIAALGSIGRRMEEFASVLDFGCGCGRTLVWLSQRFPRVRLCGTDTDSEAVEWARRALPNVDFSTNQPHPRLFWPDHCFDFVYSVSVFTHLSECDQFVWLSELRRVLKPGGVLIATVHGFRAAGLLHSSDAAMLRDRGFLFCPSQKLRGIMPAWYHTAFHTPAYIQQAWSEYVRAVRVLPEAMGVQDIVVAHA